jgi:branched-chain amino acid transport system substrate-binding protein
MLHSLRRAGALAVLCVTALAASPAAVAQEPLKVGVITFLSGPAAGPFGVPAKNASDLLAEMFNRGGMVPGYEKKGFAGRPLELTYVDEAGGPTKVVTEFRNLAARVDIVIGVISSGDCLAVAPVAEELKKFTVLFDCATNRIFEEASYK